MKYDSRKAFPYPVLPDNPEYNDDYKNRDFQASVFLELDKNNEHINKNNEHIILTAKLTLNEDAILERIKKKSANYAVHVLCPQTNYRYLVCSHDKSFEYVFKNRELHDKVTLMACVVCTEDVEQYHSPNFHPEFNNASFNLKSGSVLAIADPEIFYVDVDPARPLGAIFQLQQNDKIKKGEFDFDIAEELICILMHPEDCKRFNVKRQDRNTQNFLIMSVYYPVLMEVLHAMQSDADSHEGKKWYRAIESKLSAKDIALDKEKIYLQAQRLLDRPLGKLLLVEENKND